MRTLRLTHIAVEAEGLRLRERVKRAVTQILFGILAMVFLMGAIIFAHVALWFWLRQYWEPHAIALMLGAGDVLIALICGLLAVHFSPGRHELDAMTIRNRAWENAKGSLSMTAIVFRVLRLVGGFAVRRR